MKNLVGSFLSQEDRDRIVACVKKVEKTTSGEIVPMVAATSYHYPLSTVIGSLAASLILGFVGTAILTIVRSWGDSSYFDAWVFPAIFGVCFLVAHAVIKRADILKRIFVSPDEMREEVEEAALTSFLRRGLNDTRDQTGILIYISVFERMVHVLADRGINAKVNQETWQEIVDTITSGIRQGRQADAICEAIARCGELLESHFPVKPDDTDELDNLIIEE